MADIRIKDLTTTASSTASDDFFAADGTTNGTRKLSAFSPTFGGNATVGGTLTVNGSGSSAFATTTGFSISTGVATPSGGVGVGAIGTGGSFYVNTPSLNSNYGSGLAIDGSYPGGTGAQSVVNVKAFGVMSGGGYGSTLSFQTTLNGTFNEVMKLTSGSVVQVLGTTASTGTSSGALVVSGGVGVAGAIYAGGAVSSIQSSNSILAGASLENSSTGNAAAIRLSMTAGTRTGEINTYGSGHATLAGRIRVATSNGQIDFIPSGVFALGIDANDVAIQSGIGLKLGNAYVAGAPTATGYIVIKDSTGTSYKIPAVAL